MILSFQLVWQGVRLSSKTEEKTTGIPVPIKFSEQVIQWSCLDYNGHGSCCVLSYVIAKWKDIFSLQGVLGGNGITAQWMYKNHHRRKVLWQGCPWWTLRTHLYFLYHWDLNQTVSHFNAYCWRIEKSFAKIVIRHLFGLFSSMRCAVLDKKKKKASYKTSSNFCYFSDMFFSGSVDLNPPE